MIADLSAKKDAQIGMMNKLLALGIWAAVLAAPTMAALNKDGGKPAVNPCAERAEGCAEADADRVQPEPLVIYLDADGEELLRLPLSRFRKEKPEVKLPPSLEREH